MCAQDDRPVVRIIKAGTKMQPRRSLGDWLQAWKTVMRDPDKPIPDAGIGPEGQPIPAELDITCQECGTKLAGATEWVCPSCGEKFNPLRLYTLRMMEEPEYFLRYRLDPDEIRKALWALILVVVGLLLALVATVVAIKRGSSGHLPIWTAWSIMSPLVGLTILVTVVLHFTLDISWPRIAFFFSVVWLLVCVVLLALACV